MGELGKMIFRMLYYGKLGKASFGILKLDKLGEACFETFGELGELGEKSFGTLFSSFYLKTCRTTYQ